MEIIKSKTVAFTGHRALKFYAGNKDNNLLNVVSTEIALVIASLYEQGYNTFLSGMADGIDMIAAEEVLKFKQKKRDVRLVAVIPFRGQEDNYNAKDKFLYKQICEYADHRIYLAESYINDDQFLKRNDYLLANSSHLVCYYNGKKGGTMYTVNRAIKADMPIINIHTMLADYRANTSTAKQALQRYDYLDGLRFCKEGIMFGSLHNNPIIVPFECISKVETGRGKLHISLQNGGKYEISLFSDNCKIKFPPL